MKRRNGIFWGIMLLLAAAALLVSRLGYLEGIGIWTILFNIFLAAAFLRGFMRGSFAEILFSAAFLVIVNDELLGLEAITPWPVLGAALLGSIGLGLLFPGFGRRRGHAFSVVKVGSKGMVDETTRQDGRIGYENAFGSSVKYVSGEVSHVAVENSFGEIQIYFTDARLREGRGTVKVDTSFGNVVLYVPVGWDVTLDMANSFGSSQESGRCQPDGMNALQVEGSVSFGNLEIVYVEDRQASGEGCDAALVDLSAADGDDLNKI